MDIVTKALIEMRAHQDVAKEHGITAARVSLLVHMVKKKRLVIEELLDKQMTKRQNQKLIGKIIDQLIEDDAFIESVDDANEESEVTYGAGGGRGGREGGPARVAPLPFYSEYNEP